MKQRPNRPLPRIVMSSAMLALAMPVLAASLGCDDCEDNCRAEYEECWDGEGPVPERCSHQLLECENVCSCGESSCLLAELNFSLVQEPRRKARKRQPLGT